MPASVARITPSAIRMSATSSSAVPAPRPMPRRSSQPTSGEVTAAITAAVMTGITIVCVSDSSHTAPTSSSVTPTPSHAVRAEVAQPATAARTGRSAHAGRTQPPPAPRPGGRTSAADDAAPSVAWHQLRASPPRRQWCAHAARIRAVTSPRGRGEASDHCISTYLMGRQRCSDPVDAAIAALADARHGVVARRQLVELGMTDRAIQARLTRRLLIPLHRGVYALLTAGQLQATLGEADRRELLDPAVVQRALRRTKGRHGQGHQRLLAALDAAPARRRGADQRRACAMTSPVTKPRTLSDAPARRACP